MAEVEQTTAPSKTEEKDEKPEAVKKKRSLKLNIIIIIAAQLVLAGGGYYVVTNFIKADPAFKQAIEGQQENDAAKAEEVDKQIYLLKDIIVNPAGTRGSRYLSVSIGVEMPANAGGEGGGHGDEQSGVFDTKEPQMRDALISILSAKTISQLTAIDQKELIRQEILETFGQILDPQPVFRIYFVDFVLQ